MSSLGIDGLSSGLDTTGIINKLMQVEALPQQQLKTSLRTSTSSVTAYQVVNSRLKSAETAIAALSQPATWGAKATSVTGTAVTATSSPSALAGTATVEVVSLAARARQTSTGSSAVDGLVADGGPITVTKADGTEVSFTPVSGSLQDVVAGFNATPGTGLTASAVKVGQDRYHLVLTSIETGTAATHQSITGLTTPMDAIVDGLDAVYKVDGLEGRSATNSVTDLLPGVSVSFASAGTSTVTVNADGAKTTDAVRAVVAAVNAALEEIATQGIKDSKSTVRGPLAGDSQVRAISGNLLAAVSDAFGGRSAATIGIQTTRDGRLVLDEAAFSSALAKDPVGTRALLAPEPAADTPLTPATVPTDGVAGRLATVLQRATKTDGGTITNAIQGRERSVKDLETQIASWDRRLELRRGTLARQFSGLEVALSKMQAQSSWLSAELGSMQRSSS